MSLSLDPVHGRVARRFALGGTPIASRLISSGHIHVTVALTVETAAGPREYILQCVNHHVFEQPLEVMANMHRVTRHIRAKLAAIPGADAERGTLTIVPTLTGDDCEHIDGHWWRVFTMITGARSYDVAEDAEMAYEAALAFGRFQALLADLPGEPLYDTIPNFHNAPKRLEAFLAKVQEDPHGRAADCREQIDFALEHQHLVHRLTGALERGELPTRIVHNDTKINNVLLAEGTRKALCVIDLDTVMPGTVLYDFGDQVRSTAGRFDEGTLDLASVKLDLALFEGLVRGYLEAAGDMLTPAEIDGIAVAGQVITFTQGVRFLTDHLNGDGYFRIHHPGQNLERTRVQFTYVRDMIAKREAMEAIVARYR